MIRIKSYEEVWQRVTSFTDQNILRDEIRYIHTTETSSSFDSFKVINYSYVNQNTNRPQSFLLSISFLYLF